MDTFDEDITNEKDLISKDDMEKSNSFAIKSLNENGFNFIDILQEKFFLQIALTKSNNIVQISNKSILKIFEFFSDDKNNKENFEETLLNHITCLIQEKEDFPTINHSMGVEILDAPFVELLKRTKNYKINLNKKKNDIKEIEYIKNNLLIYEDKGNKININSNSIKKICKLLGKTIFDISDYINVLILYLNEDEINQAFIQNKIIDKYNKTEENLNFFGKKNLETNLIVPEKNNKKGISQYNHLFDKVLNRIDNVENLSEFSDEKNIEINEDDIIPKKYIEQKMIKKLNYNNNNEENNKIDDQYVLTNDDKCNCQKDICEFCNVF